MRILCPRGLLLHGYVLIDVVYSVIVLFHSGVFKNILGCSGCGGGCCAYLRNVFLFLTLRDLNLEHRVYGFHLTGFCM